MWAFTEMKFLRRFFNKADPIRSAKVIPPMPEGWNLTMSDLMEEMKEGKRKSIGSPETDWAREYARSKISASYRVYRLVNGLWTSEVEMIIETDPNDRDVIRFKLNQEGNLVVEKGYTVNNANKWVE